jgi:hypothetical protein
MKANFESENTTSLIIEEVNKHFNEKITLEEFITTLKSNSKLRDILCPVLD